MKGRKRQRRHLHSWSFAQLQSFVEYKAEERGVTVVKIDPRNTSKTCSRCGKKIEGSRKSQSQFHCKACNFQLNADLNAARNIRAKHLDTFGKPLRIQLLSTSPTEDLSSNVSMRSVRDSVVQAVML